MAIFGGDFAMRLALLSDIHGNLPALESVLADVRRRGVDAIVNPGSVGLPAFSDDLPYPYVVENGSPDAHYAIVERTPAGWLAELFAVPCDFAPMAALAGRNGRPAWAYALRSGDAGSAA